MAKKISGPSAATDAMEKPGKNLPAKPAAAAKNDSGNSVNPTGIKKLDIVLHGGIPEGHIVLLAGKPGTGKTILALQWLFAGYKQFKEAGVYISSTEVIGKTLKNTQKMSFFDKRLLGPPKIYFADLFDVAKTLKPGEEKPDKKRVDEMVALIENLVKKAGAKRLVIDSVTGIAYILDSRALIRYFILRLAAMLSSLKCTTILTSEVEGNGYSAFKVEESVSDGIILLNNLDVKERIVRQFNIVKMRGSDFYGGTLNFEITPDGIDIYQRI